MRATKLVCTLGPASGDRIPALVEAGMDVARINCSHQGPEERDRLLRAVREAASRAGRPVAIMADLSGPKVRLREIGGGAVALAEGARFILGPGREPGDEEGAATSYEDLGADLEAGDRLLLSDGQVELRVAQSGDEVVTEVLRGGTVRSRAGLNAPSERLGVPAVTPKDREDLSWALGAGVDIVAQSFVRRPEDVEELRGLLEGVPPLLVAKLETRPAVESVEAILAVADGVVVARGDLGVEAALEEIPVLQKELVARARREGVPVVIATQMLESMVEEERPTRAEAGDVANAVFEGADGILLSAETAIGAHPEVVVRTAARILEVAESRGAAFIAPPPQGPSSPDDARATCEAAADIAREGGAVAVACFTRTGRTAALLAAARPLVPIVALSPDEVVARRLALFHGVLPRTCVVPEDTDGMLTMMEAALREERCAGPGDPAVLVASTPFGRAHTNLLKVHRVGT
jgi:pyruvate kinase